MSAPVESEQWRIVPNLSAVKAKIGVLSLEGLVGELVMLATGATVSIRNR